MAAIGTLIKSDGRPVTVVEWRANRLADALAKAAVGDEKVCQVASELMSQAEALVRHEAAVVGAVTHTHTHC